MGNVAMKTVLVSIKPSVNRFRFYQVSVVPSLLGFAVVREWGRIGQRPHRKESHFSMLESADIELQRIVKTRERHGYHAVN